ncbi:hypothetical protein GUJ93_ZPchr0013g34565 [Zizania palustris]|uniref:Uncharacterized protein n=1 Tax=Zizania palustris TaxID=103762 RepID=A0A8J5X0Q7_ZIZPA|nr:hypothetical protein GUJ93_ZPchr0013g34565 [Zizania palustris]
MGGESNGGRTSRNGAATEAASSRATTVVALVFLLLLAASLLVFVLSPMGAGGEGRPREPVELAIGIDSPESWLDALRAWAKLACLKLRPPAPRYDLRSPASVKKAAEKSLEMGKETVEHSAESAARAAEETLGKTTAKLRRAPSTAPRLDGDL